MRKHDFEGSKTIFLHQNRNIVKHEKWWDAQHDKSGDASPKNMAAQPPSVAKQIVASLRYAFELRVLTDLLNF